MLRQIRGAGPHTVTGATFDFVAVPTLTLRAWRGASVMDRRATLNTMMRRYFLPDDSA